MNSTPRARLAVTLDRIEQLLAANGGAFWASQVSAARTAIESSDAWGLQKYLSLLGGMGSLNDYVLYRGGEPLVPENNELHKLLGEAAEIANNLWRAHEREGRT